MLTKSSSQKTKQACPKCAGMGALIDFSESELGRAVECECVARTRVHALLERASRSGDLLFGLRRFSASASLYIPAVQSLAGYASRSLYVTGARADFHACAAGTAMVLAMARPAWAGPLLLKDAELLAEALAKPKGDEEPERRGRSEGLVMLELGHLAKCSDGQSAVVAGEVLSRSGPTWVFGHGWGKRSAGYSDALADYLTSLPMVELPKVSNEDPEAEKERRFGQVEPRPRPRGPRPRAILAKSDTYPCSACERRIEPGVDKIVPVDVGGGRRHWIHEGCWNTATQGEHQS